MVSRMVKIGLIFCCLTAAVFALEPPFETRSVSEFEFRADETRYRLPNDTVPETYDITLVTRIDQAQFDFNGTVGIKFLVLNSTRQVTLHARQLTISNVLLIGESGGLIAVFEPTYNKTTEFLTINTKNTELTKGKRYILSIEYTGVLRTDNAGFYRSSYVNAKGTKSWIATTQFESTDARHAFPCYDEPALKANFTIRILHGASYTAISNMPESRVSNPDTNTVTTSFETTPLTSTYLIAFVVSDFKSVANPSNSKMPHRTFANPKDYLSGQFAVDEGEKVLNAIANYLHVPFSLPKMDQFAIPDFNAGAMENWGLVTYREEYLLYNKSIHMFPRKTNIVTIIAHEFGHQWFGNLVSPKWWEYIWLNEGFATLFEHLGTDLVHPEWDIFQYFIVRRLQVALQADAKETTRPMTHYVESPEAISSLFDSIAYPKSGSVLRMFLHAFTEASFKKGLTYYLTARQYAAADENDLFAALERAVKEDKTLAANLTVKDLFSSWSRQKGFPVLHVQRNANNTVTISQERYFTQNPKTPDNTTWWVPYTIASQQSPSTNNTVPTGWLARNQRSKLVEQTATVKWSANEWVLLNQQQAGYYRVQYDAENYKLLTKELVTGDLTKFHPNSRAQLIDDLSDFTKTNRLPDKLLLDLIKYLKNETQFAPWASASNAITFLTKKLEGTGHYNHFRMVVAASVEPFYKKVGLNDSDTEEHFRKYLRVIVTNLACDLGAKSCLNETYAALQKSLATGTFDSQNTRGLIYSNGIRKATAAEVEAVWTRFTKSQNSDERNEILNSFGHISNATVLSLYLNRSMIEYEYIPFTSTDRYVLVNSIAQSSQQGLALVVRLLTTHTEESIKLFAGFKQLLLNLADRITTKDLQTQYVSLLKSIREKHPEQLDENSVTRATAKVDENLKWLSVHQKPIENYLMGKDDKSGATQVLVSSFTLIIVAFFVTSYLN